MLAKIAIGRGLSVFHTSQGAFCTGRKGLVTPRSPPSISLQMGHALSVIPASSQKSSVAPACNSSVPCPPSLQRPNNRRLTLQMFQL